MKLSLKICAGLFAFVFLCGFDFNLNGEWSRHYCAHRLAEQNSSAMEQTSKRLEQYHLLLIEKHLVPEQMYEFGTQDPRDIPDVDMKYFHEGLWTMTRHSTYSDVPPDFAQNDLGIDLQTSISLLERQIEKQKVDVSSIIDSELYDELMQDWRATLFHPLGQVYTELIQQMGKTLSSLSEDTHFLSSVIELGHLWNMPANLDIETDDAQFRLVELVLGHGQLSLTAIEGIQELSSDPITAQTQMEMHLYNTAKAATLRLTHQTSPADDLLRAALHLSSKPPVLRTSANIEVYDSQTKHTYDIRYDFGPEANKNIQFNWVPLLGLDNREELIERIKDLPNSEEFFVGTVYMDDEPVLLALKTSFDDGLELAQWLYELMDFIKSNPIANLKPE